MIVRKIAILFVGLFISFAFFGVQEGHAQKILEDFKKSMPKYEFMPVEEFEAKTTLYEDTPFDDESLAYKVRISKDWEMVTDAGLSTYKLSNKIFGELARFYGPPRLMGTRSHFTIQAIELDYSLTAEQWFLQFLLSRGYMVQGMEVYDKNRVESLYVVLEGEISYVVRAVAIINGKRVSLVQYFLPIENWEEERVIQAQVIDSFQLKKIEDEIVEKLSVFHFLDIAEIQYPEGWELRMPPLRSIDNMNAQLLNISSREVTNKKIALDGKIDIKLSSVYVSESLDGEFESYRSEIRDIGLVIGDVIESHDDIKFNEGFVYAKVDVYEATDAQNSVIDYELWVSKMAAGDYYYIIALLTPSRDQDLAVWSRNSQAYKLMMSLVRPLEESIVEQ